MIVHRARKIMKQKKATATELEKRFLSSIVGESNETKPLVRINFRSRLRQAAASTATTVAPARLNVVCKLDSYLSAECRALNVQVDEVKKLSDYENILQHM